MALFGKNKEKKTEEAAKTVKAVKTVKTVKKVKADGQKIEAKKQKVSVPAMAGVSSQIAHNVIIRPRITEKSGMLSQSGVYTFEVTKFANKAMISQAVTASFKVTPVKIAIVNLPSKKTFIRGRRGSVPGVRKALVTLKKGDKIDFV